MKLPGLRAAASVAARTAALAGIAVIIGTSSMGASVALAKATPIYRCGNAYSQWPCPNARAVAIDDAAPSPAELADGARTAAMQARRAEALRAERVAAESRGRPALAGSLGPAPPRATVVPRSRRAEQRRTGRSVLGDAEGDFTAHLPAPPKRRSAPK